MPFSTLTTDDLKSYALWLSGEPTDGTSDYDSRIVQHMQTVYDALVGGGTLGMKDVAQAAGLYEHLVDIPTTDWSWLRKFPPFSFNTTPAVLGSSASAFNPLAISSIASATLTNSSTTLTLASPPVNAQGANISIAGWRFRANTQSQGISSVPITVPRILTHTAGATTATFDIAWPQETQTVSDFAIFLLEYPLPADFVRFCESPYVHGTPFVNSAPRIAIGSSEQVVDEFPLTSITQGVPDQAARVAVDTIQMNRWDTVGYRIEFSYVFQPPVLVTGSAQVPLVPQRFRSLLSFGAAMLVAHDKVDSRVGSLSSAFREFIHRMMIEYRKEQVAGSEQSGRHLYRMNHRGRRGLRTTSGLPLF